MIAYITRRILLMIPTLLGIMLVSSRFGLGASVLSAFLSVAAFDFFFVPPYLTFAVADFRHTTTFIVMFAISLVAVSTRSAASASATSNESRPPNPG